MNSGEYQINDGLLKMMSDGKIFKVGKVSAWLDCGNAKSSIYSNKEMLNFHKNDKLELISSNIKLINSNIIEPVFIGENVVVENSTIGPHVSIYNDAKISDSKLENSIIGENTEILNADIKDSMIGNNCKYNGNYKSVNIGDFSELI